MKRVAAVTLAGGVVGAVLAGAVALAARRAPAAELAAEDVVAKNVAARGGLDAWRNIKTMVWMGRVESARAPAPSMPFALEQKRPNRTRLQIDAVGQRSTRVFDGLRGWKVLPSSQGQPSVQPYTAQELKSAQAGHGIDGPLIDHAAKGNSVTLEGVDEVGSRKAYHLKLHLATGGAEDVWVDTETYLELRYDRMADAPGGGQRRLSMTFADYRDVDGVKIPFVIETGTGQGTAPDRMRIERVVLNAPLEDAVFENPADPRYRHRTRTSAAPSLTPAVPSSAANAASAVPAAAPR